MSSTQLVRWKLIKLALLALAIGIFSEDATMMSLLHYLTWIARRMCRKRIDHFRFRSHRYYCCYCYQPLHYFRGLEYGHWREGRSCVSCQSHPKGVWHPWLRRELKKAYPWSKDQKSFRFGGFFWSGKREKMSNSKSWIFSVKSQCFVFTKK